jgi:hypothetical protein
MISFLKIEEANHDAANDYIMDVKPVFITHGTKEESLSENHPSSPRRSGPLGAS